MGITMFGIIESLTKATVGLAVEAPLAIAADVVTMAGALNNKEEPHIVTALKTVGDNVTNATKPNQPPPR